MTRLLHTASRRYPGRMPETAYGHGERWSSKVFVRLTAPPPPQLIEAPGARFVVLSEPPSAPPPRASDYGLIIAWAPIERRVGSWACLLAWDGWRDDETGRPRPSARWSWARFDKALFRYHMPWPDQPEGLRWFGRHHGDHLELAWFEAVESLPEQLRAAALQKADYSGPPEP